MGIALSVVAMGDPFVVVVVQIFFYI